MEKERKRKKGGGRKFTDGRLSEKQMIRKLKEYFEHDTSVKKFVAQTKITRQTYYRFLNKYPEAKKEVAEKQKRNLDVNKKRILSLGESVVISDFEVI